MNTRTNGQTHKTHTNKLIYRKHRPRGQMLWKSRIRETPNLFGDAYSSTDTFFFIPLASFKGLIAFFSPDFFSLSTAPLFFADAAKWLFSKNKRFFSLPLQKGPMWPLEMRHTNEHMNIVTARPKRPKGRFWENSLRGKFQAFLWIFVNQWEL